MSTPGKALAAFAAAETELARRERRRPAALTAAERAAVLALADDLDTVWAADTTTDKDRKQLLHPASTASRCPTP